MLKKALNTIVERIVMKHPHPFKAALLKRDPSIFVQELGNRSRISWDDFRPQDGIGGFEDLVTLFTVGKFNRAIARLDLDEAALLFKTVRCIAPSVGVEIGRASGGSTLLLALAVGASGKVTSVDLTPSHDEELSEVLARTSLRDRVRLIVGDSRTLELSEQAVDWAFIDGGHDYEVARSDHNRFGRLVRPGGYIIHHDATKARPNATGCEQLMRLRDEILASQTDVLGHWREAGSLIAFERTSAPWQPV